MSTVNIMNKKRQPQQSPEIYLVPTQANAYYEITETMSLKGPPTEILI